MWLTTSDEGATGPLLSHEMVHVVLHWRFPKGMPAWASEGAASMWDDNECKVIRHKRLRQIVSANSWPDLEELLSTKRLGSANIESYAVAESLVQLLLDRSGRETFLGFVEDGAKGGWNKSLKLHYGIQDVQQLQLLWQAHVVRQFAVKK